MGNWITIKKNGKRQAVPVGSPRRGPIRPLSEKEMRDLKKIGIRHPGSLTSLGYHISEPAAAKHQALNKAVKKYGRKETLRKLAELYRLNVNRSGNRNKVLQDIRYVSGVNDKSSRSLKIRTNEKDIVSKLNTITKSDMSDDLKQKQVAAILNRYRASPNSNDGTIFDPAYKLPHSKRYFYFNYADNDWDWSKGSWNVDNSDREELQMRRR